jgi:hypothetical protein
MNKMAGAIVKPIDTAVSRVFLSLTVASIAPHNDGGVRQIVERARPPNFTSGVQHRGEPEQMSRPHDIVAPPLWDTPWARPGGFVAAYSLSRRAFFRLRFRANACLTRSFWPGLR